MWAPEQGKEEEDIFFHHIHLPTPKVTTLSPLEMLFILFIHPIFLFLIHSADPQTRPVVIIIFVHVSVRTFKNIAKETSLENNDHYWWECGSGWGDHSPHLPIFYLNFFLRKKRRRRHSIKNCQKWRSNGGKTKYALRRTPCMKIMTIIGCGLVGRSEVYRLVFILK